ncbi:hypothetical protein X975_04285, partial [Stegodyphus mimosarum]
MLSLDLVKEANFLSSFSRFSGLGILLMLSYQLKESKNSKPLQILA